MMDVRDLSNALYELADYVFSKLDDREERRLRDEFALRYPVEWTVVHSNGGKSYSGEMAYRYADAMMAARGRAAPSPLRPSPHPYR